MVNFSDADSGTKPMLLRLNIWRQSLEQRRDYYLATQMYKCVHGFAPKLLCDMIVIASDLNVRNTCKTDSLNVYISKPNIEYLII